MTNSSNYMALDVILDKTYLGHCINGDTIFHFGPPADILLASESTKDIYFVDMPPGIIFLTPVSIKIEQQKKWPWQ